MPALQPASGAHIQDGACALGRVPRSNPPLIWNLAHGRQYHDPSASPCRSLAASPCSGNISIAQILVAFNGQFFGALFSLRPLAKHDAIRDGKVKSHLGAMHFISDFTANFDDLRNFRKRKTRDFLLQEEVFARCACGCGRSTVGPCAFLRKFAQSAAPGCTVCAKSHGHVHW